MNEIPVSPVGLVLPPAEPLNSRRYQCSASGSPLMFLECEDFFTY